MVAPAGVFHKRTASRRAATRYNSAVSDPAPPPASPIEPRLRLEFSYEFDEFAEAQQAYAGGGAVRGKWRNWIGWVLFGGLAVVLFLLMNQQRSGPRPTPPIVPPTPAQNWVYNILLPVIPWLLIFGFIWFFVFRQLRRSGAFPRTESNLYEPGAEPPPRPERREPEAGSSFAWGLLAVPAIGAGLVLLYFARGGRPGGGAGSDPWQVLLPVVPWVLICLFIWFVVFRATRGGLKALWDAQPALHRPHVVEVYDDRIVFSDAVDRLEHKWEAFTHVRESPGLFLLFTSTYAMHILPKRAFPGRRPFPCCPPVERPRPCPIILPFPTGAEKRSCLRWA